VRRALFVLMLGLCLFAAAGPLVEAADCEQVCADDQDCSTDACCSCCVHFRVDPPRSGGVASCALESRPVVSGSQPKVPMTFDYADESDPGPYPFPAPGTVKIEVPITLPRPRDPLSVEFLDHQKQLLRHLGQETHA
jgi:hypothetical protein